MVIMDWLRKLQDIIMPIETFPEDEEETAEKKVEAKPAEQVQQQQQQTQAQVLAETMAARRASMGGSSTASSANYTAYKDANARPNLKIIKPPEFVMKVYRPTDYSQINSVADDILAKKAAVVNYEYVQVKEQRRICDYIDGVCYAVDGSVTRISEKIFLYVPAGISASDIEALVASVRYH